MLAVDLRVPQQVKETNPLAADDGFWSVKPMGVIPTNKILTPFATILKITNLSCVRPVYS